MDGATEELREWSRRWRKYREWADADSAAAPAPDPRPPQQIMSDLEFFYRSCPEEVRRKDPDPEKLGIQNLHRVFARLAAR